MSTQTFKTTDVVRLEVEVTPVGLYNLVPNPSGLLGAWAWLTPVAGSYVLRSERPGSVSGTEWNLRYTSPNPAAASYFTTEPLPIAAGQYAAAFWNAQGDPTYTRHSFEWLNAAGAVISSSALSGYSAVPAAWATRSYGPFQAPAGTVAVRLRIDLYSNTSGAAPGAGYVYDFEKVTVAKAATSAALASLGYLEPIQYTNILGPTHDVHITRDEFDLGLLTATILDSTLDPATAATLRPGRRVRVTVLEPVTSTWTPLIAAKIRNAKVTYDYAVTGPKRAQISLTAVDNVAALAAATRVEGVATIDKLPYVLEGVGVPWSCNGYGGHSIGATTVVARNPSATALDQIGVTRDSVRGYAWVDRFGVLQAWDANKISTTVRGTVDEDDYSELLVDYDTDRCINTVNLKYLRINLATGDTVEVPYGPYVDQASVDAYGPHSADFTVQGITESPANMSAYASAVINANGIPTVHVNSVALPISTPADIAKALRDLYDLVTVTNTNAGIAASLRVTGVEHSIVPDKWITNYNFAADGGVAPPQPAAAAGVAATASGGGVAGLAVATAANVDSSGVRVHVRGGVAVVNVSAVTTGAVAAAAVLFTLPDGARPVNNRGFVDVVNVATNAAVRLHVELDGTVPTQAALASGVTLRGQFVVPL